MQWNDLIRSEARLVSRFALIGVLATLVHLEVGFTLVSFVHIPLQPANLCGFLAAVGISYSGHYHFSFKSSKIHKIALPRFLITVLIAYGSSALVIFVLSSWTALPENICLLFGAGIIPFVSFVLSRIWVY